MLEFSLNILRAFGFQDFQAYLSTRNPAKAAGSPEQWEAPTEALRKALIRAGVDYQIDEGEATFYGPKIDIKVRDGLGREWQLSTIQFDFTLPENFNLVYVGEDGQHNYCSSTRSQPYDCCGYLASTSGSNRTRRIY